MDILMSICIPTYNRSASVVNCVKSILRFDVDWIEVIVTDNASLDNTEVELSKIIDPRFSYYRNEANIGYRNIYQSTVNARGEFLFLLSDEDWIEEIKWDELKNELVQNKNINVFHADEIPTMYKEPITTYLGDSYMAYSSTYFLGYMSGIIIRRSCIIEMKDKGIYDTSEVWQLYPHKIMTFKAVKTGGYRVLSCMVFNHTSSSFVDLKAHAPRKDVPYISMESSYRRNLEWLEITDSTIETALVKEKFLHLISSECEIGVYRYCKWIYESDNYTKYESCTEHRMYSYWKWVQCLLKYTFLINKQMNCVLKKRSLYLSMRHVWVTFKYLLISCKGIYDVRRGRMANG